MTTQTPSDHFMTSPDPSVDGETTAWFFDHWMGKQSANQLPKKAKQFSRRYPEHDNWRIGGSEHKWDE